MCILYGIKGGKARRPCRHSSKKVGLAWDKEEMEMDWDSEKDDEQKKTKKGKNKALTAIAAVLITILVGGVIGGGIGVTTWYANKEHSKSTSTGYSFAQNGYSGNSVQALLSVPQTDSSIADICEKMEGSVVTVVTQIMTQNLFQTAQTAEGLGSGIIFDEDADHVYIVTNAHVIEDAKTGLYLL